MWQGLEIITGNPEIVLLKPILTSGRIPLVIDPKVLERSSVPLKAFPVVVMLSYGIKHSSLSSKYKETARR